MTSRTKKVSKRIAAELARLPASQMPEGVVPLNPGFFKMQQIRANARPKERADVRAKINGRQ